MYGLLDVVQSSGAIALNELVMRLSAGPRQVVEDLERAQRQRLITISGPLAEKLSSPEKVLSLTDQDILEASDTYIEPSWNSLKSSFTS